MTNSKLRNSDSAYSICFSQVSLKLFTFLINTADKEIYNIDIYSAWASPEGFVCGGGGASNQWGLGGCKPPSSP